jgi:hypothetical protein
VLIAGVSLALFAASLTRDGYYTGDQRTPSGACIGLLLLGWLGIFDGVLAWLANPLLAAAWIVIWIRRPGFAACGLAGTALAFSLSFLLHQDLLINGAGHRSAITGYGAGYWLWIGSIATMVVGGGAVELTTSGATDAPGRRA